MSLVPVYATAPSAWASYLINGDASGMGATDREQCDAWLAREDIGKPVSCEPAGFQCTHDAYNECPLAAECDTYTFLIEQLGCI